MCECYVECVGEGGGGVVYCNCVVFGFGNFGKVVDVVFFFDVGYLVVLFGQDFVGVGLMFYVEENLVVW